MSLREQMTNGWTANLSAAVTAGDSTFYLTTVSGLPVDGQVHVKVDANEWVILPLNGTTTITGVTRGVDGTVAIGHAAGAVVKQALTAEALANLLDQLNPIARLATVEAVDLNTATPTTLYTVPATKANGEVVSVCFITHLVVRNPSTSLTTVSLGIGWTSATFVDVIASATHTELTDVTLYTVLVANVGALRGTPGQVLKLLCTILQGAAATVTVDLFGYLY